MIHQQLKDRAREIRASETFTSFHELSLEFRRGSDFDILNRQSCSPVLVATPHGGVIEPGSDHLVQLIADKFNFSMYAFRSLTSHSVNSLRITSTRFNEPILEEMLKGASVVLGIHTCPGNIGIFVGGGANSRERSKLIEQLRAAGFRANSDQVYEGASKRNFCNRGKHPGFQLEIHQQYLDDLMTSEQEKKLDLLVEVLGSFLQGHVEKLELK